MNFEQKHLIGKQKPAALVFLFAAGFPLIHFLQSIFFSDSYRGFMSF